MEYCAAVRGQAGSGQRPNQNYTSNHQAGWKLTGAIEAKPQQEESGPDIGTYNLYPHVPPPSRSPDPPTPDSRPLAWRHAASLELPGGSSLHLIGWPTNPFTDSFPQFAVFHFYHDDL
ncbi:hypothetical protein B0T13DRAFT_449720 [Neurospora crassa]|nr:hypothetical protein B0T13DRAFT_449720 [Neurospora crassa]